MPLTLCRSAKRTCTHRYVGFFVMLATMFFNAASTVAAVSPIFGVPQERIAGVPLMRFRHKVLGTHFYTADPAESKLLADSGEWESEGITGYVFRQQAKGTVPLYRYKQIRQDNHTIYAYQTNERGYGDAQQGYVSLGGEGLYTFDGIACYVAKERVSGTVPLFDLVNNQYGHFLTANSDEQANALNKLGYSSPRGDDGFVWTTPVTLEAEILRSLGSSLPSGGIVDLGHTDLRQKADVNRDGMLDYCRFIGDAPKTLLSCQIGNPDGSYSPNPYGFNSIQGIDQGHADLPRGLIDINGDKRADFCRYVGVRGAGENVHLACDLAGAGGFDQAQYTDPSTFGYLGLGDKAKLLMAPDGTPIFYKSSSKTGEWNAIGVNASGIELRVKGGSKAKLNPPNPSITLYSVWMDLYKYGNPDPMLRIAMDWDSRHLFSRIWITSNYPGSGTGGPEGGIGSKGLELFVFDASASNVGYGSVDLRIWDCSKSQTLKRDICETGFGGKVYKPSVIDWGRNAPQPLTEYLPKEMSELAYFQPVFDANSAAMDAVFKTGLEWFDSKHWYEHTSDDLGRAESALTAEAKARIDAVQNCIGFLKTLATIEGAVVAGALGGGAVGGVFGAGAGSFLGNMVFDPFGRWAVDTIREQDAEFCRMHPDELGCYDIQKVRKK
jgi:hypothetical protein